MFRLDAANILLRSAEKRRYKKESVMTGKLLRVFPLEARRP
jgi:hypothetical protein